MAKPIRSRNNFQGRNSRDSNNSRDSDRGFRNNRNSRDSGRRDNFNRSSNTRTKVICSSCKKECFVPFKPTGSKPILCDDCFRKKPRFESSENPVSKEQYEAINKKLDEILNLLKSQNSKK